MLFAACRCSMSSCGNKTQARQCPTSKIRNSTFIVCMNSQCTYEVFINRLAMSHKTFHQLHSCHSCFH
jgi:hypothetical protein